MDELSDKIARLLSSPEGMEKIRNVMSSLGAETQPAAVPQTVARTAAPIAVQAAPPADTAGGEPPGQGTIDPALIGRILPLLRPLEQENEDTRLLEALRPYLHGEREQRLEETMRLLRLTRLLPLLQESGMLGHGREG